MYYSLTALTQEEATTVILLDVMTFNLLDYNMDFGFLFIGLNLDFNCRLHLFRQLHKEDWAGTYVATVLRRVDYIQFTEFCDISIVH